MSAIVKLRTALSIAIALVPCVQAFTAEPYQLPTLADYPPAVTTYVIKRFEAERDALQERAILQDDVESIVREDCGPALNNAHKVYLQAFKAATLSKKRMLLLKAAAMPCFEFTTVNFDYLGDLRNGTRILANEAVLCAAQEDTEGAVTMLTAGYGLLAHHTRAPTLLIHLTRTACQDLLDGTLRTLLATHILNDRQLKLLDDAVARATRPDGLARVWFYEKFEASSEDPLADVSIVYLTDAESQAQLLMARIALAVERYLLEHGSPPVSLEALIPVYLSTLPIDPLIGDVMGYQKNDEAYALFSVGKEGIVPERPLEDAEEGSTTHRKLLVLPVLKKTAPLAEMPWSTLNLEDSRNSRKEKRAIKLVRESVDLSQACGGANRAVFYAGPLDRGYGVIFDACQGVGQTIPVQAAFWVSKKQVYTVNSWARDLAGDLPESPSHIDFEAVRDVVH